MMENNIAKYLASQIMQDKIVYDNIKTVYPQYMDDIDHILKQNNCLEKYKK